VLSNNDHAEKHGCIAKMLRINIEDFNEDDLNLSIEQIQYGD
jgi:hypothetical protein